MIKDSPPVWKEDVWTPYGKWMDGWETRRKRTQGNDWCIIKLFLPSLPDNIIFDTAFFTGNYTPKVRLQALSYDDYMNSLEIQENVEKLIELRKKSRELNPIYGRMGTKSTEEEDLLVSKLNSNNWNEILPFSPLDSGVELTRITKFNINHNLCNNNNIKNGILLLKVSMGPDGGIARLKLLGNVVPSSLLTSTISSTISTSTSSSFPSSSSYVELSSIMYGSKIISCSDQHYGNPVLILLPNDGKANYEGWQTSRQPLRPTCYELDSNGYLMNPGCHNVIIQLGISGIPYEILIDTTSFIGNSPESIMIEGLNNETNEWFILLNRNFVLPNTKNYFTINNNNNIIINKIKFSIFPDGGIMRFKLYGIPK